MTTEPTPANVRKHWNDMTPPWPIERLRETTALSDRHAGDPSGVWRAATVRVADIRALLAERDQLRQQLTGALAETRTAYRERAQLAALLAALYPSGKVHADPGWPDWPVLYITLPTGQASFHYHPDDAHLIAHVPRDDTVTWDGHSTDEKYQRIRELTAALSAPQPDDPPAYSWAESVACHAGTIIIPITGPDGRDAEVSLDDTAQAVLLADMLRDAAGQPTDTGPTDWGPGGTEWTVGFTYPDGQHVATLDRYTEAGARHSAATWHGDPGEHAMPLRRQVGPWVEAEQSAPLPGDAFRADLARELRDPKFRREFTAELTRIDATQTPPTTWIHEGVTYDLTQPLVDGDGDTWHHTGWSTSIDGYRTMPRFTWTDADPEEHGYRGWRLDLIDAEHGPLTQPDAPDA